MQGKCPRYCTINWASICHIRKQITWSKKWRKVLENILYFVIKNTICLIYRMPLKIKISNNIYSVCLNRCILFTEILTWHFVNSRKQYLSNGNMIIKEYLLGLDRIELMWQTLQTTDHFLIHLIWFTEPARSLSQIQRQ